MPHILAADGCSCGFSGDSGGGELPRPPHSQQSEDPALQAASDQRPLDGCGECRRGKGAGSHSAGEAARTAAASPSHSCLRSLLFSQGFRRGPGAPFLFTAPFESPKARRVTGSPCPLLPTQLPPFQLCGFSHTYLELYRLYRICELIPTHSFVPKSLFCDSFHPSWRPGFFHTCSLSAPRPPISPAFAGIYLNL